MNKKETRGRKPLKDKKDLISLFIAKSEIKKAGGKEATKRLLYALFRSQLAEITLAEDLNKINR